MSEFIRGTAPGANHTQVTVGAAVVTPIADVDIQMLEMRFGVGASFAEIARQFGMPLTDARLRVSRLVESMRTNPGLRERIGLPPL